MIRYGKNYLNYSQTKVREIFGKLSIEEMGKETAIKHGSSTMNELKRVEMKETRDRQGLQ